MSTLLHITPDRFIASEGKLDTNKRYLFRDDLGSLLRMPITTEWQGMIISDPWGNVAVGISDVMIDPAAGWRGVAVPNIIANPPQTVGLRL